MRVHIFFNYRGRRISFSVTTVCFQAIKVNYFILQNIGGIFMAEDEIAEENQRAAILEMTMDVVVA